MSLERCDICDELTGGAGRLDDSLVCAECNRVICANCQAAFNEVVICKPCARRVNRWIPVSERLPEVCEDVLGLWNHGVDVVYLGKDGGWYGPTDGNAFNAPLCWIPLPESPEAST